MKLADRVPLNRILLKDGFPWRGHVKEALAVPQTLALTTLWRTLPLSFRERAFGNGNHTGRPVICLPGYSLNSSIFLPLARRLARAGIGPVCGVDYDPLFGSIESHAERLAAAVSGVLERASGDKVSLVGHSMGGVVARHYLQEMSGTEKVDRLIMLETPHRGSRIMRYSYGECGRQMDTRHPFMERFKAGESRLEGLPMLCIYSNVNPWNLFGDIYQIRDGRSDCFHPGYGHLGVVYGRSVAERVVDFILDGRQSTHMDR